jgi:solute carrier family 45 protein 1/2/4
MLRLDYDESTRTGRPKALIDHGDTRRGLLALSVFGFVSLAVSMILPLLVSRWQIMSMRRLWMMSNLLFAIFMLSMSILSSSTVALVLCSIVGFSWAVSSWIPYALLGAEASVSPHFQGYGLTGFEGLDAEEKLQDEELRPGDGNLANDMGLLYGIHNLAICLPQIFLSLAMGLERMLSHEDHIQGRPGGGPGESLIWIFRIAGAAALVSMYFIDGIRGDS